MRKLLGSSAAVTVRVGSGAEAGDPEIVTMQQGRLLAVSIRTLALSYGRGALTLGEYFIASLGCTLGGDEWCEYGEEIRMRVQGYNPVPNPVTNIS